mgnify:CR=1 FL=1
MNEWNNSLINEEIYVPAVNFDSCTERITKWMDEWIDRWMNALMDEIMYALMDEIIN